MPAATGNRPSHELLHAAVTSGVDALINDDPTIPIYEDWQEIVSGRDRDQVSAIAEEVAGELEAVVKLVREDTDSTLDDAERELEGMTPLSKLEQTAEAIRSALDIYQQEHPLQLERERAEREAREAAAHEAEQRRAAVQAMEREAEKARRRAHMERDRARWQAEWEARDARWGHLETAVDRPAEPITPTRAEKVTIVSASEWQGVYLDGKLIAEGHSINVYDLAQALGFHVEYGPEVDEGFLEHAGGMTVRLDDLPAAPLR